MASPNEVPFPLALAGRLTVRGIDEVYSRVRDALADHAAVVVDCSAADAIDLSFVQLLLAAHRSAGQRVSLAAPVPTMLREALFRGGLLDGEAAGHPLWRDAVAPGGGIAP